MAKLSMLVSSTSQTVNIFIQDSSVSTGAGKTGLVFNTASLVAYYALPKAAPVAITLATLASATAAYSSGGFFELDATNMPGLYRLDIPNAALASGRFCTIMLKGATNMAPCVLEIELTAVDNQSTAYGLTLAKTTNITGFNDIAASAIVSSGAITTSGGAVSTVTAVTNQLTAAAIATGVWQDAVAGDFTIASSIGKSLYIANIAPGASGGHFISGTNSGTTTVGALTCTGSLTISDGLLISRSSSNTSAITATGNGTGSGVVFTSGSGATGDGIQATAASTNGNGVKFAKTGSGSDFNASSTPLILAKTTNITGFNDIAASAVVSGGAITTSGGAVSTVTAVTNRVTANTDQLASQTVTAAAGVTFPSSVASPTNITAGIITTVTNLTNAPTAGDFTATMKTSLNAATPASVTGAVGSVTGNVGGNVVGSVGSVVSGVTVTTNNDKTGYSLTQTFPTNFSSLAITAGGAITAGTVSDKTGYALTSVYDFAKGTVAMTESYPTKGATATPAQILYNIMQHLNEMSITGTTMTLLKRDQATTAKTFTLNDATNPTSVTEAT